jgi:polyhydroxybutyrate depolymerase
MIRSHRSRTLLRAVASALAAALFASLATPTDAAAAEASAGCGAATGRDAVRGERRTLTVGNETRAYVLDAPGGETPAPVVLSFHGFQGSAESQRAGTGFVPLATRESVVLVHPDGHEGVRLLGSVGRGWDLGTSETRDLEFVRALLDTLERERCIDRKRVYATGFSNGAFFANLVGCRMADRVAAIAPVAGGMALPACTPATPVAVMIVFGRADDIVPIAVGRAARDWWAQTLRCRPPSDDDGCSLYDGCTAPLAYCEGPQEHRWPPETAERVWKFFAANPKK